MYREREREYIQNLNAEIGRVGSDPARRQILALF